MSEKNENRVISAESDLRIAQINMVNYGSTGKIMLQIAERARNNHISVNTYSTHLFSFRYKESSPAQYGHTYFGTYIENGIHYILGTIFGNNGFFSAIGTRRLISRLKHFNPDIIHLHNLHGFCINLPTLFNYIKKNNIKTIWTLHDCWSFTGHCPYFTLAGCDKWKSGCGKCPQLEVYPKSYIDTTRLMFKKKQKCFLGVKDLTIVTPSEWLAGLVRQSFLKDYPVKVINNGIDLSVYKPTPSDFRERYNISAEQKILLGVAFGWGRRKGLDVFVKLAESLPDTYKIVLVGTDDKTDSELPSNIISIHRTNNQQELAEIYTAADLFVNPTREENYPTVNMESLACGTPVLTFKTGGSPEIIDETCGSVVECDDFDAFQGEIERICTEKPYSAEACLARAKSFDMNERFREYISLYTQNDC